MESHAKGREEKEESKKPEKGERENRERGFLEIFSSLPLPCLPPPSAPITGLSPFSSQRASPPWTHKMDEPVCLAFPK